MVRKLTSFIIGSTNWDNDGSLMFAQELLDKTENATSYGLF